MGRRNSGEGRLYERSDGYGVAQYNGVYRYSKDKRTARKKLNQLMSQAVEATPKNIPIGKVLDDYLAAATPNLKPRMVEVSGSYRNTPQTCFR